MTNGGVASPSTTSGAGRVSRSSSKPVPQSSQRKRQSQQSSGSELPCTPARRRKLDPSGEGLKGSSIAAERQTRQRSKGREGSSELPVGTSESKGGGPERLEGEEQPFARSQDVVMTPTVPSIAEANYVWVQCDLCNKWRELPKGHVVSHQVVYHIV